MPKVLINKELLVIACGRSGTSYTSKVFRQAGYDLKHEAVGSFGCVSMYMVTKTTDCSIVNKGQKVGIHEGESREGYHFNHIWHQVRHPLKSIDSLAKAFTRKVRLWTADQLGVPLPGRSKELQCPLKDKLHWAMHYWLINNLRSEEQAEWTFQLEEFPWEEMLERLGLSFCPLPEVSKTTHRGLRFAFKSKEQSELIKQQLYDTDWENLGEINRKLMEEIQQRAKEWGYNVPTKKPRRSSGVVSRNLRN